jgi:hypothetical protein
VSGKRRDVVRLVITRALRDLAVEIQGVDAAHGIATVDLPSSGELRLVLLEKIGREVKLDPLQIVKLMRKAPERGRAQAPYHLTIGGAEPRPVTLAPNQSRPLTLTLGGRQRFELGRQCVVKKYGGTCKWPQERSGSVKSPVLNVLVVRRLHKQQ